MGLLKRLFPWYRWDDRWEHHVFMIPDGNLAQSVTWTAETGFRYRILAINFSVVAGAGLSKRFPDVTLWRGSRRFLHMTTSAFFSGSATTEVTLSADYPRAGPNNAIFHLVDGFPSLAFLLPGDRLIIGAEAIGAFDRLIDIVVTMQRWID